jgi:hypothetical protein
MEDWASLLIRWSKCQDCGQLEGVGEVDICMEKELDNTRSG